MTDDQQAETPKRGRPRGSTSKPKPPPVRRDSVHRGPHRGPHYDDGHGDLLENFEYRPFEARDALAIDADTVRSVRDEWGYSLLWVCFESLGRPFPELVNARKANGYAEVVRGNFGGSLDHLADRDGRMVKEGLVLMARPTQIEEMARQHDKRAAKAAVENMRRSHRDEGLSGISMPEGNSAAARVRNVHKTSYEPGPKVPE
jgi:hypothetical protein